MANQKKIQESRQDVSADRLNEMAKVDIRTVQLDELADINDVSIDESLPKEEKIRSYMEQIKNPYCFRSGDVVIKIGFAGKTSLDEWRTVWHSIYVLCCPTSF